MAAIEIVRRDLDAAGLRRAAGRSRDAAAARRMLALALVLEGSSRAQAAQAAGMDRQTLRDWVHRYNAEGLAGLSDRKGAVGPKRRLSPEQEAEVAEWVRRGPDLGRAWRGPLASGRSGPRDRGAVRGGAGRAQRGRRAPAARLPAAGGASSPPRPRCCGAGVFQSGFAALVDERLPEHARGQAARALVAGRGSHRPAGHAHPGLGRARLASGRAPRPALLLGLPVRRDLPRAGYGRRAGAAGG